MKKLFALALALCLLCSFALAEEEVPTLNWADVEDQVKESGSFQQVAFPDVATLLYWVPNNMAAADVSQIPEDVPPVAAFATADGNYLLRVYALNTTGLEDYLNLLQGQGAGHRRIVREILVQRDAGGGLRLFRSPEVGLPEAHVHDVDSLGLQVVAHLVHGEGHGRGQASHSLGHSRFTHG